MKMRSVTFLVVCLFQAMLAGQDTLSLNRCLDAVVENAPRLKDRELIADESGLQQQMIKAAWLPTLMLNGKASYQSDVVSIEIADPAFPFQFPVMPHDQYGLNLDIQQTLYDGGLSRQRKAYEAQKMATDIQKIEVDLYGLKEKTAALYFSLLLVQENRKNLELVLDNLKSRESVLQAALSSGAALESDLMVIRVEIIQLLQALSELDAAKAGVLGMLSVFMNSDISPECILMNPYLMPGDAEELSRPELGWLEMQSATLDAGKELAAAKRMPRLYAFGQTGVGRPGYNMLNDQFDTYYMVGAGLQWNIWDWNSSRREQEILEKRKQVIGHAKETFTMQLDAGLKQELERMDHYRNTLNLDEKMVEMRMEISRVAASRLDNGEISAAQYMLEINSEKQARIRLSTHKVQMMQSVVNYNLLQGTL